MVGFTNNFTDELRARLSIVDIVSRRVPLTKKGKDFWGCCPFHNEKTPSFKVNEEMGRFYCFGCGEKGDIISFIMKTQNMQYPEAIRELADIAGLKVPEYKPKTPEQTAREQSYVDIMDSAARLYSEKLFEPVGSAALEYIRKRGFTDDVIKKYRLGYAPAGNIISAKLSRLPFANLRATGLARESTRGGAPYDFFRERLMFPIFDPRGQIIAFSGRSMDGSEPKYINTPETELFHKGRTVFGLNFARDAIHRMNRSIVVEGQIDVIQMQTHGFPETVAPLGTALTSDHLQILCKLNRNITFCFDGDKAGQKAAARAVDLMMPLLRPESDVQFAFVANGKDPDEIIKSENTKTEITSPGMKKIIDSAVPLADFLWNLANTGFIIATPGGRANAEKFLRAAVEKIADPMLKNEFLKEYDQRKFNEWHKWQKTGRKPQAANIDIPEIGALEQKTLSEIAAAYPELIEKHSEFLLKIGANLTPAADAATPAAGAGVISDSDAEKFIVSLKLKNYLQNLQAEKKALTAKILAAANPKDPSLSADMQHTDSEIEKTMEKIKLLAEI